MSTTYTQLPNTKSTGDTLAATQWNDTTAAIDRVAVQGYKAQWNGVLSGWNLTSGLSTVTSGQGLVGPCWCRSTASQSISNLAAGSTNYVYAVTDADSAHSGTIDFKARTVSGAVTNYDAQTSGVLVGGGTFATGSGFTAFFTRNRQTYPVYRREAEEYVTAGDLRVPSNSGATGSTVQGSTVYTLLKFPSGSITQAVWPFRVREDYSGTITIGTQWLSTGASGSMALDLDAYCAGAGDTYDGAPVATGAGGYVGVGGTSNKLALLTGTWASNLATAGDWAVLRIKRDGTDTSGPMAGDALLRGVTVRYETQL